MVDGDSVYFYERPAQYKNAYILTRLDAATGALIWRSNRIFYNIINSQPIALGDYIYVFLYPNTVCTFEKETGELSAIAEKGSEEKWLSRSIAAYGDYLYFGFLVREREGSFVRFNVNDIEHNKNEIVQTVIPEIIWEPETKNSIHSIPAVDNNIIYTCTYTSTIPDRPIELAGFDIDTKEMVFYQKFGGIEDVKAGNISYPDDGGNMGRSPLLIHEGILYYISVSITAWDLKTGEKLYRHVFTNDIPNEKRYYSAGGLHSVYYNGKIYSMDGNHNDGDGRRNIHCIDAATGALVWNDISKLSVTLGTNPVIANGRLYITQSCGLRVYVPETGRLIGVDKSFIGNDLDRVVLYKDLMICLLLDSNSASESWELVAVDVSK